MATHSCLQALTATSNPVAGERVPQCYASEQGFHSRECQAYLCQLLGAGHYGVALDGSGKTSLKSWRQTRERSIH